MDLKDVRQKLGKAYGDNNTEAIKELEAELVKAKLTEAKAQQDKRKVEAEKAVKEAEAMAGAREALALELKGVIDGLKLGAKLATVKAFGFTYSVDHTQKSPEDGTDVKVIGGLALRTPEIAKVKRASNGGGIARGSGEFAQTTTTTGYTPQKAFDEFATVEDKAKLAKALTSSAQWRVREDVRQRAIKAGQIIVK